jgi:hypothetical protein
MNTSSKVTLSELRAARHRLSRLGRANSLTSREEPTSRQAIARLLKSDLTKAGVEFDKFDALIQQSQAEVRQRAADLMAEARKNSAAVQQDLHRTLNNLTDRVERLEGNCQVNRDRARQERALHGLLISGRHLDARFLAPDLECLGASTPIVARCHEMTP